MAVLETEATGTFFATAAVFQVAFTGLREQAFTDYAATEGLIATCRLLELNEEAYESRGYDRAPPHGESKSKRRKIQNF